MELCLVSVILLVALRASGLASPNRDHRHSTHQALVLHPPLSGTAVAAEEAHVAKASWVIHSHVLDGQISDAAEVISPAWRGAVAVGGLDSGPV